MGSSPRTAHRASRAKPAVYHTGAAPTFDLASAAVAAPLSRHNDNAAIAALQQAPRHPRAAALRCAAVNHGRTRTSQELNVDASWV